MSSLRSLCRHMIGLSLLLPLGCDGAASNHSAPAPEGRPKPHTDPKAVSEPETANEPAPIPLSFACGRASASLPGESLVLTDQAQPCIDPGYPQDLDVRGVAGASSVHVVRRKACDLRLEAGERVPDPFSNDAPRAPGETGVDGPVELNTPEGSTFYLKVTPVSPKCTSERAAVVTSLRKSLRVVPLRDQGTHVRATISSAGHGFELDTPAGFYVVSRGGMTDQYETSYQLRGPKGAWATLYTSWRSSPSEPATFTPTLFAPRVRFRSAAIDPATESEGCRSTLATGPDKRLKVEVTLCGPAEGHAELEQLLRAIRLTPARPQ